MFANHVEINNGLSYLSSAGWASYNVAGLPGPFRGALCVWIDLSWTDAQPGTEIPLEVIVELVTPIKTATFSEMNSVIITPAERTGFDRVSFAFPLAGTAHEAGLHVLDVSCNTGLALVNTSTSPSNLRPKSQLYDLTRLRTASNVRCLAHADAPAGVVGRWTLGSAALCAASDTSARQPRRHLLGWSKRSHASIRALAVAGHLANECRASPDGGQRKTTD